MNWYQRKWSSLTAEEWEQCMALMQPHRQEQVKKIKNHAALQRTVLGEWMAKTAISQRCDIPIEQVSLQRTQQGKPYVEGLGVHFNISHSGETVVCAVDSVPIGIDVEQIRPRRLSLARRICTPADAAYLAEGGTEQEKLLRLYRIWTAKEAYFKWKGTGITDLRSISFEDILPHCQQFLQDDYMIAIVK